MKSSYACVALALACAVAGLAGAQELRKDTVVRVQASGIESGWHEGRIGRGGSCTMVLLDKKTRGGYTSLALNAIGRMQRREGGGWVDVDVKPALAKESKSCREAAND